MLEVCVIQHALSFHRFSIDRGKCKIAGTNRLKVLMEVHPFLSGLVTIPANICVSQEKWHKIFYVKMFV